MNIVLVGMQWGDEGKGKVIDILSRKVDYIVRYQGGIVLNQSSLKWDNMDPFTKHTIFAMLVGYFVSASLDLPLWPSIALGLLVGVIAHVLARMENNHGKSNE